ATGKAAQRCWQPTWRAGAYFFPDSRHFAVGQKYAPALHVGCQHLCAAFPVAMDDFRDSVALFRIKDGGLEEVFPGQLAETLVQSVPACDRAGNCHRIDSFKRHPAEILSSQVLDGEPLGRPATGIEPIKLAWLGLPAHGKQV